jgi:hypothetical protein
MIIKSIIQLISNMIKKFNFIFLCWVLSLVFKSSLVWSETLEAVIADSNLYTVKIDVSTEMPFIRG